MKNLYCLTLLVFLFSCHQDDSILPPAQNDNPFDIENLDVDINNQSQCDFITPLYPEFAGDELKNYIKFCFSPSTTYTYAEARTFLYSNVDVIDGKLQCIYSGYEIELERAPSQSFINAAAEQGINCEHSYPQSMGASQEPAQSDMYHIYPALGYVNSARSNKYYAEIPDNVTNEWFFEQQVSTTIPTTNIDDWSENGGQTWEPREEIKGDIARGIFYFRLIYETRANQGFFTQMRQTLLDWHEADPVDQKERNRNNKIRQLQGNDNPFIIDPELANRIFG